MPCAGFENLLLDYDRLPPAGRASVDAHLSVCPGCRAFLERLARVDTALGAALSGARVSAGFAAAVLARTARRAGAARTSAIPELLDLAGWTALLAAGAGLAWRFAPPALPQVTLATAVAVGSAVAAVGCWFGVRCWATLR